MKFKITKIYGGADGGDNEDFIPEKIIYVELDDEITMVFDKIKRLKQKRVAIVVPRRAAILQSIVNLRILKQKIDSLGKEILIVTLDRGGRALAEKTGFKVTESILQKDKRDAGDTRRVIAANASNAGKSIRRSMQERVSISDVINPEAERSWLGGIMKKTIEKIKKKKQESRGLKIVLTAPNKQALFTLILVSVLLVLAIAYIALPGATVYITPRASILDPSFNITFLDYERHRNSFENSSLGQSLIIPSYPVRPPQFEKTVTRAATGKIFKGENATGAITVKNLSPLPWDLAERTRFQTEDGIVFRTPSAIRIPAAYPSGAPGTLDVPVAADELDAYGQIIGARGNIGPSKFFLPGIKNEENRKKLYGESAAPMTGGITDYAVSVSKEDIEAAQKALTAETASSAVDDLKRYVEEQNLVAKTNLSLLTDRNAVEIGEAEVTIPTGILGSEIGQFEVKAFYSASGVSYDRFLLTELLKERIKSRVDPDKKLISIADEDISYRFLEIDKAAGKIRLTATMRARQAYELDPEKENGARFIKKITDHIAGMRVKDATSYLQQQTDEIANVEIKTWPIWAPAIPNIADNIKFVIRDEEEIDD